MNSPDDPLVRKALGGDREAFDAVWAALTPKLFGYLVNVLRDRAAAEDALQTTWIKAAGAVTRLRSGDANIAAWLFAIARNECRERWRSAKREVPFELPQHDAPADTEGGLEEKLAAERILALLSEDDREALRLRYIADLSTQDIARVLGVSAVAARVRIHRALSRARAAMKSHLQ